MSQRGSTAIPQIEHSGRICPSCRKENPSLGHFCVRCGASLSGPVGSGAAAPDADAPFSAPDEMLAELQAATMGEYEVLGELGRGGMAMVFLARDVALDRMVAIKVMAPSALLHEGMPERFKREARTAASLRHPNIVTIFAVHETERLVYFVMEGLMGRSLEAILRERGPLSIPAVRMILIEVGKALAHAHQHGVVHRDVKPGNIMVNEQGGVVVTDFGIAQVSGGTDLTISGAMIGTPAYMSPEQCREKDEEITPASDQYSLGIVAYELLTGITPFQADTTVAMLHAHMHQEPRPLADFRPDCPATLARAIQRMIDKTPANRFRTLEGALLEIGEPESAHPDYPVRDELVRLGSTASPARRLSAEHAARPRSSGALPAHDPDAPTIRVTSEPGAPHDTVAWRLERGLAVAAGLVAALFTVTVGWRQFERLAATAARATAVAAADSTRRRDSLRVAAAVAAARVLTPPPPLTDTTEVRRVIKRRITEFERAIESRQLASLLRAYPGLSADEQREYEQLFREASRVRLKLNVERIKIDGPSAEVRIRGTRFIVLRKTGERQTGDFNRKALLAYGPTGWRITEIR